MFGMGYVILLWHFLSHPYNYFGGLFVTRLSSIYSLVAYMFKALVTSKVVLSYCHATADILMKLHSNASCFSLANSQVRVYRTIGSLVKTI